MYQKYKELDNIPSVDVLDQSFKICPSLQNTRIYLVILSTFLKQEEFLIRKDRPTKQHGYLKPRVM